MRHQHKPLFSLLWLLPLVALADTDPFVARGNAALQNNQPEEALAQYLKAEATLPNNPDLAFNKGGALYAQKKYQEAATEFLAATSNKNSTRIQRRMCSPHCMSGAEDTTRGPSIQATSSGHSQCRLTPGQPVARDRPDDPQGPFRPRPH